MTKPAIQRPAKLRSFQRPNGMMGLLAFFSTHVKMQRRKTEPIRMAMMNALFQP
jgi:hypothetical protein